MTQLLSVLEWNTKEIIKEWDENRKTAVREKCKEWLRLSYCFSVLYHDKVMGNFLLAYCENEYAGEKVLDDLKIENK